MSVPPLAGLEGQGCGALGGRGAAGRLLSALPQHPSTFQCSAPNAFLQPHFHQGCCSGGGHLGPRCQGCCGACSSPFPGFYSRLFVVWKTSGSWSPVIDLSHLHRFVDVSPFQMETIQSVLLSVRQGDWMASIDLKEAYLQVPVHPASRHFLRFVFRDRVYQFKALCFGLSTALQVFTRVMAPVSAILHSMGYPHEALPRRLARPVFLSRIPRPGSSDCSPPLSRVGDCGRSSKVQPDSIAGCPVSRGDDRHHIFQGFSIAGTHLQATVNSRRISVLHLASCELMALATGRPFFAGSPSSWRPFANEVSPALPPPVLGSSGSRGSGVGVTGMSPRPPVVAPPSSPVFRSVSLPGVSRPTLLVRRLGRGVGCPSRPSGRFRPVGLASGSVVHQRQGTVGRTAGSSPVPVLSTRSHGGCLLRQHHGGGVSPQGGRHEVSSPQLLGPGDLALDRVSFHPPGSTISSGLQQCPRGRSVSPPPAPTFRVVAEYDRLSVFKKVWAGPNRLVCHLRKSALFDLLLTIPRSDVSRHRRISPVLSYNELQ